MPHEQYEALFARDVAVGHSNIRTDTIDFRFRDETFSVPTVSTIGIGTWNGHFYTTKIKKLRELMKRVLEQQESGNGD